MSIERKPASIEGTKLVPLFIKEDENTSSRCPQCASFTVIARPQYQECTTCGFVTQC